MYLLAGMLISLYIISTTEDGKSLGVDDALVIVLMWPLFIYFMASRGE